MSDVKWTKEQMQAIKEKDSNILVAAAAGSGKTAVLVERIINKIINENIDIDRLLVVTFTNAAAAEMRERVLEAIYKKIDEEPDNINLQRQVTLLNKASICTIDSFCLDVVRNNFYQLENISPNFRIADTTEIELLKQEILEDMFEIKYEKEDEKFSSLINTYTSYRDDTPLKDLILKIYTYIQSDPFPSEWLKGKIELFNIEDINKDFSERIYGKILLEEIQEELIDDIRTMEEVKKTLSNNSELEKFYITVCDDIDKIQKLINNLDNWDKAYQCYSDFKFATWPRKKCDSEIKENAKIIRDDMKKKLTNKLNKILICSSEEANLDIQEMYPILNNLKDIILEFSDEFSKRKRNKNIVDFNDIEHLALNILLKKENDKIEITEVAKKYQEKFIEIAIDEYQDSNMVQEYILTSISKENNIFMVGDVKQSIYKFRQAMPELFLSKYRNYKIKQEKEKGDSLKIQLFKNFRSRDNVLDFTNLIFQDIMDEKLGEINYDEREYLNLGANYKEINQNLKTEINIINLNEEEKEEYIEDGDEEEEKEQLERIEDIQVEARFVANKIKELVDSKFQIFDRKLNGFRNIKYKDIVILLRSTRMNAPIFEEEISNLDMPVFSESSQEYLNSIEIQTIISLLKIIDNPIQDIPLVTVLRSHIGKFTDDELVEIRLSDKYDNFYDAMQKAKMSVNANLKNKIDTFFKQLEIWRKEQEYLALDEFIWKLYTDTGFYNYVGLMQNGDLKQANLKMLFERAKQYETASFKGLYNFINFIEKIHTSSGDLGSAKLIGENDDVIRIMSIHKSKGLEFPVVFLSSTGKQFNLMDLNQNILLHQELGIGVKYIDYNKQVQYDTLTKEAIKNKILTETLSEEMRILYVALTRAKEKLYITGLKKDYEKEVEKMQVQVNKYPKENNKINHILVKKYKKYLDWILLVYLYEKEQVKDLMELKVINKIDVLKNISKEEKEEIDVQKILNSKAKNKKKVEELDDILKYNYKYKLATTIPTMTSVTQIKQLKNNKDNQIIRRDITFNTPNFMRNDEEKKISAAEKGTLVHLCMQRLNIKEEYNLEKIKQLINDLVKRDIINKIEADNINPYKILNFTKSEIWKEMKNAKKIYKERPFFINIPAKDIYNEELEEELLVQGIIDLYYINQNNEIILVDYKTDYVEKDKKQELISKYKAQLDLYKKALEETYKKKVKNVYIYSVYLEEILKIY